MPEVKKPLSEYVTFFLDSTKINTDLIVKSVMYQMKKHGKLVNGDLDKTVANWTKKPTFTYTVTSNDLSLRMGLTDWVNNGRLQGDHSVVPADWHWVWLNKGTTERWAVMSGDWKSKTSVGTLSSGAGAGGVVRRGKSQMVAPKEGIKARKWIPLIHNARFPAYVSDMNKTLARISTKIWI